MNSLTPDIVGTICRNAGKLSPEQIARECGVSLGTVRRVASEQRLDMRIDVTHPTPIEQLSAAGNTSKRSPIARYAHVSVNLSADDYETAVAKTREHNLPRGALFAALFKGALTSGTFDSLVALGRKEIRK